MKTLIEFFDRNMAVAFVLAVLALTSLVACDAYDTLDQETRIKIIEKRLDSLETHTEHATDSTQSTP